MDQQHTHATPLSPQQVRIDWRRLVKWLLATLIVPVLLAILFDLLIATLPILTLITSLICIPVATIFVSRAILSEMDRVLTVLAPAVPKLEDDTVENPNGAGSAGARA